MVREPFPTPTKAVETYGDWQVFPNGEIRNAKRQLRILPNRLKEPDWFLKLYQYPWMVSGWNTFIPAFIEACDLAGIEIVTIDFSSPISDIIFQ